MPLTDYERKALDEIEKFVKRPQDGPLGRLSLKGFSRPMVAFEVVGPWAAPR